jgi:hypothetical protein
MKFLLASLKTFSNSKNVSESHVKFLFGFLHQKQTKNVKIISAHSQSSVLTFRAVKQIFTS